MQELSTNSFPKLSKAKLSAFTREIDSLLTKLHEDTIAAKKTQKDIDRLRKSNDRSFERMKRAVEKLEAY